MVIFKNQNRCIMCFTCDLFRSHQGTRELTHILQRSKNIPPEVPHSGTVHFSREGVLGSGTGV